MSGVPVGLEFERLGEISSGIKGDVTPVRAPVHDRLCCVDMGFNLGFCLGLEDRAASFQLD